MKDIFYRNKTSRSLIIIIHLSTNSNLSELNQIFSLRAFNTGVQPRPDFSDSPASENAVRYYSAQERCATVSSELMQGKDERGEGGLRLRSTCVSRSLLQFDCSVLFKRSSLRSIFKIHPLRNFRILNIELQIIR